MRDYDSVSTLRAALDNRTTSATDLAHRARQSAKEAKSTFITVAEHDGVATAHSDARITAGSPRSALEGIPIAVKDVINTDGLRTTMGSHLFSENVPTQDAPLIAQLKNAGATVIGKTNTHEFSYGIRGDAGAFGVVTNPHDVTRVAGGSSSGSAAAVAKGIVPLAVGTDTAGSVRVPAALCGVVGFKPTYGLLDTSGIFPLSPSFDTAGFLATSVSDIALTMHAIGFDTISHDDDDIGTLRFSTLADNPILGGGGFADATGQGLAELLETPDVLHPTLDGRPIDFMEIYNVVRAREAFLIHEDSVASEPALYQPSTLAKLQAGAEIPDREVARKLAAIPAIVEQYLHAFRDTDILLSSTVPIDAPLLHEKSGSSSDALMSQVIIWNILGWPALSIPYWSPGHSLPLSVQVIGKPGRDADVLRAGMHVQHLLSTHVTAMS